MLLVVHCTLSSHHTYKLSLVVKYECYHPIIWGIKAFMFSKVIKTYCCFQLWWSKLLGISSAFSFCIMYLPHLMLSLYYWLHTVNRYPLCLYYIGSIKKKKDLFLITWICFLLLIWICFLLLIHVNPIVMTFHRLLKPHTDIVDYR